MLKWLIIGFLLACLIFFMLEVGQAMDYDPSWDVIDEDERKKDEQ